MFLFMVLSQWRCIWLVFLFMVPSQWRLIICTLYFVTNSVCYLVCIVFIVFHNDIWTDTLLYISLCAITIYWTIFFILFCLIVYWVYTLSIWLIIFIISTLFGCVLLILLSLSFPFLVRSLSFQCPTFRCLAPLLLQMSDLWHLFLSLIHI